MQLSQQLAEYVRACFAGVWIESHEHEDAALEKIPVEIGHQTAYIPRRVGPSRFLVRCFEVVHQGPCPAVPVLIVALIDAVDFSSLWDTDILMGKEKFAYTWKESETMHTGSFSSGVDHHSA